MTDDDAFEETELLAKAGCVPLLQSRNKGRIVSSRLSDICLLSVTYDIK
jgi:hypothetical protein